MNAASLVETAGNDLRRAVSSGLHNEAAAILEDYRRAVETQVRQLQPGDSKAVRLLTEALELIEWARRTSLAERAHYSWQLAGMPDLRPYGAAPGRPSAWNVLV